MHCYVGYIKSLYRFFLVYSNLEETRGNVLDVPVSILVSTKSTYTNRVTKNVPKLYDLDIYPLRLLSDYIRGNKDKWYNRRLTINYTDCIRVIAPNICDSTGSPYEMYQEFSDRTPENFNRIVKGHLDYYIKYILEPKFVVTNDVTDKYLIYSNILSDDFRKVVYFKLR